MAAGQSSPRLPAININYNQGEMAGAELGSAYMPSHLNNSLSLTQLRPDPADAFAPSASSTSKSDALRDVEEFVTITALSRM